MSEVNEVYAAKGKKSVHVDLRKEKIDAETMSKFILGPTGNLRAPTVWVGKIMLVGFNEDAYKKVFKL